MVLAMVKNNGVQLNKEICGWKLVFFSLLFHNCTETLNAVSLVDDSPAPQYAAKVGGRLSEKAILMVKYKDNIFQNHIFQTYFLAPRKPFYIDSSLPWNPRGFWMLMNHKLSAQEHFV